MLTNKSEILIVTCFNKLKMLRSAILLLVILVSNFVFCQADTIRLKNPSFEGTPKRGGFDFEENLDGWFDCGQKRLMNESPPDVHPDGFWKVTKPAYEGKTYLGVVVRDNYSYESVSTQLSSPLKADQIYTLSLYMATSKNYYSLSRKTENPVNFDTPTLLRIWGASDLCGEKELLYESLAIKNEEWQKYEITLKPLKDCTFLTLSAYFTKYKKGLEFPYNGNILLDNISDIIRVK